MGLGGPCQREEHAAARWAPGPPQFSYKWLRCCPRLQCSSRHNTRWPRPGGTKNGGRTRACAGILLPYSRKGSWASWKRACSRNLTFTLGLEGSGRLNPRSSPGSAAQGCYMFMLPRGGEAIPVFITALGPVPPVGPEMLSAGEIKWFFPMK